MRKTRSDDHIRCDIVIDRQIHPELFESLSKISDSRRRASFLRICAEKYIVSQANASAYSAALQRHPASDATYTHPGGKSQTSSVSLTARTAVSDTPSDHTGPGALDQASSASPYEVPSAARPARPAVIGVQELPANISSPAPLTARPLVSVKQGGASMLAGVLGDLTPGLM